MLLKSEKFKLKSQNIKTNYWELDIFEDEII